MTALYKSACLLKYHIGNLYMSFGRLVKGGSNHFSLHASAHVGNLLRTLIYKENNFIYLRMVIRNSIGNRLQQDCLTGLRLSHDESALALSDRRKHIHNPAGKVVLMTMSEKIEFLIREKRSKEIKRNTVSDELRSTSVDEVNLDEREILVTLFRRTDFSGYGIAVLEGVILYLVL